MSPVTLPGSGVSRSRPGDPTGVATESPSDAIVAVTCHPLRSYGPEHQHRHSDLHPIEHTFDVKSGIPRANLRTFRPHVAECTQEQRGPRPARWTGTLLA